MRLFKTVQKMAASKNSFKSFESYFIKRPSTLFKMEKIKILKEYIQRWEEDLSKQGV